MKDYKQFLGGSIEIAPATETSDIIWENYYYTYKYKGSKECYRFGIKMIIFLLLVVSAVIIFWTQKLQHAYIDRYEKCTNIKLFEDKFKNDFEEFIDVIYNENRLEITKPIHEQDYSNYFSCFCQIVHPIVNASPKEKKEGIARLMGNAEDILGAIGSRFGFKFKKINDEIKFKARMKMLKKKNIMTQVVDKNGK